GGRMSGGDGHFLGIDFGTSNSLCCVVPARTARPEPVHFGGNKVPSIATAVLWEQADGRERVNDFGTGAEDGWGVAPPREGRGWRLAANFKPDIAVSEQARSDARAFLRAVRDHLVVHGLLPGGKAPEQMAVLVGVPARVLPGHEEWTRRL